MRKIRLRRAARWRLLRRRVFDWPSIFIAFSGIALWWLWPNNLTGISVTPRLQKPIVSFVTQNAEKKELISSPTVFALPSIYGFSAINEASAMPDVNDAWYNSSPHYLARDTVSTNDSEIVKLISITTDRQNKLFSNSRITAGVKPIFTASAEAKRKIDVISYGDLQKYQFEMPEMDITLFDENKSWIIRLLVQVDEKGYPDQVFVEKGSNIPEVDAKIIRLINQGRLKKTGLSCEGRITVNFGL